MGKTLLLYIISFVLLLVVLLFFNLAYRKLTTYSDFTNKNNTVYNIYQNLSREINNAAILNPDLVKATNFLKTGKLFFTDSQSVSQHVELLRSTVRDSTNIQIAEKLGTLITAEIPWLLKSNVPDSIINQRSPEHIASFKRIDSLITLGIQRTVFLVNHGQTQLDKEINTARVWMFLFIALAGSLLFYTTVNLFRQQNKRKGKEKELEAVFNRINDGVVSVDNNWRYTFLNDAAMATHPGGREETLGRVIWNVHPEMKGTIFWDKYHEAVRTRKVVEIDDHYAPMDIHFSVKVYPSGDGLTIIYRDVTERRKTERQLLQTVKELQDYKFALDESSIVAITDQKGIITHANQNFCKISKYSAEELIGQDHRIINSGYHDASFIRYLWVTIAHGKIWRGEFRNKAKDGSVYWVDTTIVPFLNEDGKPYQYLSIRKDITEKKKAEQQLQLAHDRLSFHIDNAPLGFIEWDDQLRVRSWSKRAEEIFGWTEKEFISIQKDGYSQVYGEDFPWVNKIAGQLLSGDVERNNIQHRNYKKDGDIIWCEWFNSVLKDRNGKVLTILSLVQDITERKEAEQDLLQSKMRLNQAQAVAHLGSWELNLATNIPKWSDEAFRIYGLNPGDSLTMDEWVSFIHPDDMETTKQRIGKSQAETSDLAMNLKIVRKDGAVRHVYSETKYEFDKKGKPVGMYGIVHDITETKEAEEELSRNELRFRTLTSNAPVGIFQTDIAGKTIYVNESWLEYTGLTFEEAMGDGWRETLHPDDKEKQIRQWKEKLQRGLESSSEFRLIDKKGDIKWVIGRATPMFDKSNAITGYIGTLSDITDRKKLELELLEQQRSEQLKITATALEAQEKERTALGMELHDNVNQILVGAKLLLSMVKNNPNKTQELVDTSMGHLQEAIDENRKLSHKLVTPDLELENLPIQLAHLANSMLETAGVKTHLDATNFREELLTDQQNIAVYRIAQEQCTNIIKYALAKNVTISLQTMDGFFKMSISDDGQGMEEGKATKGIGLKNITGRVSIFNGKSEIRTEPGKGFTLEVEMPVTKQTV